MEPDLRAELLRRAARDQDARKRAGHDWAAAYLTDRVLLAEGQPQEYGTQMAGRDGRWQPRQLREPGTVDQRGVTCPGCGWATTVWVGDSAEPPGAARW